MRILFLIHELALNGAVTSLFAQVRFLIGRGHSVTVATPPLDARTGAMSGRFAAAGARIVSSLDPREFDVAIGCTVLAVEHLQRLPGRLPIIWWIHEGTAGLRYLLAHPTGIPMLHHAHTIIIPSRAVAERIYAPLLGGPDAQKIEVIPAIIPPPPPGPAAEKPPGVTRVLCVGSVYPRKRQVDLVRALSLLGDVQVEGIFAGEMFSLEPPGPDLVKARPERYRLLGGVAPESLHEHYRSADVFSLPSADENMPMSAIEATWHKLPLVLSALDCYDGIWYHGYNALLHPVGDVEMLAWQIRMLAENPALGQRLAANARRTAQRFSLERNGALFEAVLLAATGG